MFHLRARGFVARAVLGTEPLDYEQGRYTATVREIKLLASAVPLAFVRKHHPSWKWSSYPKKYTTIDGPIENRLEELLNIHQSSFTEPLTEGGSKSAWGTVYERNPIARQ
ncbi:MAG: hypothetical protein ACR2JB_04310 [Bryobacteraceae bacterium]